MKKTMILAAFGASLSAAATGCTSTLLARANGLSLYEERERDGRYYVMGSAAAVREFETSGQLPVTKTKIGAGPDRKTVVLESDKKDAKYDQALWLIFRRNHGL